MDRHPSSGNQLPRRKFHQRVLGLGLALLTPIASSCGSIMYPERRGQARRGPLDWKVIALDGIFLVLFIIPGAVAFIVDWYNGTLFLPNSSYGQAGEEKLRKVSLSGPKPTMEEVLAAVKRETQQDIDLNHDTYYTQELTSIEEFESAEQQIIAHYNLDETVFRCQSED